MANLSFPFSTLFLPFLIVFLSSCFSHACKCNFKSIISFGDSLADTGNGFYLSKSANEPPFYAFLPYGESFFHYPTGRSSDGRLIIDFIAEEFGLPFVEPFYGVNRNTSDWGGGVNFAVYGAAALEDSFFHQKGIQVYMANVSLRVQLSWFKQFCPNYSDCRTSLATSLVLVGEIGVNDYNFAFSGGKTEAEVRSYVPKVVREIGLTVNELINLGAVTLLVPGNFPIGCWAFSLTYFMNSKEEDYDPETGCIKWLNRLSEYHNKLLQMELQRIQKLHPQATIIYADYYNSAMNIYRSPNKYGFAENETLRACCGATGPYNVNFTVKCGDPESNCCEDPSKYVNWDGLHLTEAFYKWIAKGLLEGSYTIPSFRNICGSCSSAAGSYDH